MERLHLSAGAYGFHTQLSDSAAVADRAMVLVVVTREDGSGVMDLIKGQFKVSLFANGNQSFGLEAPSLKIIQFTAEDAPFYSMMVENQHGGPGAQRARSSSSRLDGH